jgi:hypothetical protein
MGEEIRNLPQDFIKQLENFGFTKLVTGNMDRENEYLYDDPRLKIKIMDREWILFKYKIPLYGKDGEFYFEECRGKGFDIIDVIKAIDKLKEIN